MPVSDEIVLSKDHVYSRGLVTYTSVSAVIKSVMPTSYDGIDIAVLENAKQRGIWVDATLASWLRNEQPVISKDFANEHPDWVERLQLLVKWWKNAGYYPQMTLENPQMQVTLSDETNLIAGTCDFLTSKEIVDLKVVSELQPSYQLQLGAYASMSGAKNVGIIHVTKDRVRLVPYDIDQCMFSWDTALAWFKEKKRLEKRK